jgi:hypothetical protein
MLSEGKKVTGTMLGRSCLASGTKTLPLAAALKNRLSGQC